MRVQHVAKSVALPYPLLDRPLDDFCRNPERGVFALPSRLDHLWDVVIADVGGVKLGWMRDGVLSSSGRDHFRSELPSRKVMANLPLGKDESEIMKLLGEPSRTWYDLVPIVDALIPITRVFGRDTKHCDYHLFTTTPSSELVRMTIWLSYTKNPDDDWLLSHVSWQTEEN